VTGTQLTTFVPLYTCNNISLKMAGMAADSGVPRGGVWGVQTPPEILKISVESSIA